MAEVVEFVRLLPLGVVCAAPALALFVYLPAVEEV